MKSSRSKKFFSFDPQVSFREKESVAGTPTPMTPMKVKFASPIQSPRLPNEEEPAGSEVLKTLRFSLNPRTYHRRKKQKSLHVAVIDHLKSHVAVLKNDANKLMSPRGGITITQKPKLRQSHSVVRGTISVLFNEESTSKLPLIKKSGNGPTQETEEVDVAKKVRDKSRVDLINWLLDNKKSVLTKINENKQTMMSWIVYLNYVNRSEFDELLMALGIAYDSNLFEKLFKLFDLNGNGVIGQREAVLALELFEEHSFEGKLKMFFELVDEDRRGFLDEEKLVRFFKKNLRFEEDRKKVRPAVKAMLTKELHLSSKGVLKREDLEKACEEVKCLREIIEANVTCMMTTEKPKPKLNSTNLIASQLQPNQIGFSLPYMERLVNAIKEKEMIAYKFASLQNNYTKSFKYLREVAGGSDAQDQDMF